MRITNTMRINDFLRHVENRNTNIYNLQNQISSGFQLHRPSDDPVGVQQALMLSAQISQNDQYARNVDNGLGRLSYSETVLSDLNDLIVNLDALALQGDNDTVTEEDRQALAVEAQQIIDQMISLANTQYNGVYIFGGQWTLTRPFEATQEPGGITSGVSQVQSGPLGEIFREIGPNETMAVNIPGDQLFMPDGEGQMSDLFYVAISIRDELQNGEPPSEEFPDQLPALRDALTAVRERISGFQTTVGARVDRLNNVSDMLSGNNLSLTDALSNVEDTDMVDAAMNLQLDQTAYQATLSVAAMIMQPSLLDYLGTA
jgi:flagellar hook-associated protein 3 FlgL